MAKRKRSVAAEKARAPAKVRAELGRSPAASKDQTKGQTLRLNLDAWRQLRYMAFDNDVTAHDLLLEAVNDLFKKYGKPPVA